MENYTQVKVLGKGSFGSAWLVQRNADKAQFVAKEVRLAILKPAERESAKHEIDMLRSLNHPNITKYVDHFEHRGSLYIVMEYANGGDLYMKVKQRNGVLFTEEGVLNYFSQICLALSYLHGKRILHRDLKLQNVFLTQDGVVKLGDFGISTVLRSTYELKRTVCGTPYYFSPELCLNKPYNNKSDVWALGCILYEMVTLNHAFDGNNMKALVQKILTGVYPPISPSFSSNMSTLIAAMLHMDPHKRPNASQIIALPFIRESLTTLQREVQLANMGNKSVVSAEEKYAMQAEAQRRQEEYRRQEQEKAAKLAEQRQQQRALLEHRQKENDERKRKILEQQRELQRIQEENLQKRRKELDIRLREQRKLQEKQIKATAAIQREREEIWNRNMQEQAEAARARYSAESQPMAPGNVRGCSPAVLPSRGGDAVSTYEEMRRQAALNKQRVLAEIAGPSPNGPIAPLAPVRTKAPPPTASGAPFPDKASVAMPKTQAEIEEARRKAFWEMRREAEKNRQKMLGGGGVVDVVPAVDGANVCVEKRAPAPSSVSEPASCANGNQVDTSGSSHESLTDSAPDGEEGYRAFINGEAVASKTPMLEDRREDYGALNTAITEALQSSVKDDQGDFDDDEFGNTDLFRFVLDGETLHLPNVQASDPLMHRIESLRMFLGNIMGEDHLLSCYRAMNNISAMDEEAMQFIAETLPDSKHRFIPLIAQLIVCEDVFNRQGMVNK